MSELTTNSITRAASEVGREQRRPLPLDAVLADLDRALHDGEMRTRRAVPTGFEELDRVLGGGLKPGELMLIGGGQGIGKTTLTLQMARNLSVAGANVLYVCYEHDERYLLTRLMTMENVDPDGEDEDERGLRLRDVLARLDHVGHGDSAGLQALITSYPTLARAAERMSVYANRLLLLRGSGDYTDLQALTAEVAAVREDDPTTPCILFLDYLQKVPVQPEAPNESERVTRVVEGLKELSLSLGVSVVTIVAAEREGLQAARLRLHHLRGSSAMLYEADVILILNEKYRIVTKHHLTFNAHQAQELHAWIVCSVEKNRTGRQLIDLEYLKRFEYACFDPADRLVTDTLIDERIEVE